MVKTAPEVETPIAAAATTTTYNYAVGYLRAFVVVLVVAHHAALAYHPFAPPPALSLVAQPRWWQAFPVVDPQRGTWAAILTGFNDVFFMSLMFLVSGLFVWSGLKRKGAGPFLRGRFLRLGLPFVVASAVVAPLSYYPAYLQTARNSGVAGFFQQWFSLGVWPSGPAWFVWVLLVFDCVAVLLFRASHRWAQTLDRPVRLFAVLVGASAVVYIPLELVFTSLHWTAFGPFTFQTSRILHYLVYFLVGAGLGALGLEYGPLSPVGKLSRRWPLWVVASLVMFLVISAAVLTMDLTSIRTRVVVDLMFSVSCAASCFAFLALFVRFARSRSALFERLARNSYGVYLLHYAFVSWLQLALIAATAPQLAKFAIIVSGAVAASCFATAALRRIPAVARVV